MDYSRYKGHTPGPWTISTQDTCCVIVDEKDKPIAVNPTDTPEETEANARLMADAPALLEMCKALEAKCKGLEYMLLTRSLPRASDRKKTQPIKKEYYDYVDEF